jgi:HNH endonuclease
MAFKGPEPFPGALCRHLDDDRANNRPDNLEWGTTIDNALDAIRNNRLARGEHNPMAIFTPDQIREIRLRRESGESGRKLAVEFKCSAHTVYAISRREIWKHI